MQNFAVTVFQSLKNGDLYAIVLRVSVDQSIDWVRQNVQAIAYQGIAQDSLGRRLGEPVALWVEAA